MKTKFILPFILFLVIIAGCSEPESKSVSGRWPAGKAWTWHEKTGWLRGCNFQPSSAVNQLEMWQEETFDPKTIERELGWAAELGFNVMRVYLHSYAWKQDPEGFKNRFDKYLSISSQYGIGTVPVFFDDCWNEIAYPGPQPEPQTGIHNSGWVQDPSCDLREDTTSLYPWLEDYVKDILSTFRNDKRVIIWDLYNEPGNSGHCDTSYPLLRNVFKWAREINPSQPVTSGIWRLNLIKLNEFQIQNSDIISYHNYLAPEMHLTWLRLLETHGRPMICTEYLARQFNSRFQNIMPILKEENVGAINWGLVSGKTNTIYVWDKPMAEGGEPDIWFTDIFRKDGTPFDEEEIRIIKQLNEALIE